MSVMWEEYLPDPTPVDEADLDLVATRRGVVLPAGYREAVRHHAGHLPAAQGVPVGARGVATVGPLFFVRDGFQGEDEDQNLWYWVDAIDDLYDGDLAAALVPFASNTAQGIFAFDYRAGGEPAVVFLDMAAAADQISIHAVADTWEGFLAALQQ
ncbi:MAG: SMI1/KNR4 family protein [Arachnia sp.]